MPKKILITGATGLIGRNLCKSLIERKDALTIFTTNIEKAKKRIPGAKEYFEWNYYYPGDWGYLLNNKDAIIHLAGANLQAHRWNTVYKKTILESRELSTKNLINAIEKVPNKPKIFISSSAAGYYGDRDDEELYEDSMPGNDFLAEVCKKWESAAINAKSVGLRSVILRSGIVLSLDAEILKTMKRQFKYYAGGYIGSGNQWFPWVHINDVVKIYLKSLDDEKVYGIYNICAPDLVTMKQFVKTFGKIINRPSYFRVSKFILKIILGEMSESITASIKMNPKKLIDSGYKFKYEDLEDALKDLLI